MKSTFKKFQTISGREISVRPNFSKKIFTIKTEAATYKTYKLSDNEFNENLFNSGNDWQYFLKTSQDYFSVK
jgi:hypothetical protein